MSTVYLVGAGPGDPALISVRGLKCLERADVVVYDHLVNPRLLAAAPPRAERIDVGAAAPQPLEQEAICLLLAEKAREGRTVVRLKWGDPFFFDSGGKEAIFLHEQAIRFEVVPGVPATIAVPSYAGVPLTYPGAGETVTFVRGHEDGSSQPPRIDWATLAKLDGTIACYGGARQIPGILRSLIEEGRAPGDMAAIVHDGTLPGQQTLCGTIEDLLHRLEQEPLKAAGIIVIGPVAGLREHLRWFDARPLFGKRVVVTRAREQAADLVERLEELGAQTIDAAAFRIEPPLDSSALDEACAAAGTFDWIVFTSQNAVEHFMRRLLAGPGDVRSLKGPKICAVGPVTADRLARYGLKVDVVPAEHRAERAAAAMAAHGDLGGKSVLYPKSEIARDVLVDDLRKAGARVTAVVAYRTVPEAPREDTPDIYKMLLERQIDAVTFTSASSVRHFVHTMGEDQAADLLASTVVASIGPVTAEAAQQLGIHSAIVPKEYNVAALVQALVDHFRQEGSSPEP